MRASGPPISPLVVITCLILIADITSSKAIHVLPVHSPPHNASLVIYLEKRVGDIRRLADGGEAAVLPTRSHGYNALVYKGKYRLVGISLRFFKNYMLEKEVSPIYLLQNFIKII